jgi:hypothetical protein
MGIKKELIICEQFQPSSQIYREKQCLTKHNDKEKGQKPMLKCIGYLWLFWLSWWIVCGFWYNPLKPLNEQTIVPPLAICCVSFIFCICMVWIYQCFQ